MSISKAAAIVGAAEANEIGYPDEPRTSLQLHIEAIKNVSDYTGIPISAIEGVFSTAWSSDLAEHLGLHPKYIDTTAVGGCSFEMHVHHALCAIYAGVIDVALVSHGENGWSQRRVGREGGPSYPAHRDAPGVQMTIPYGFSGPPSQYAHAMVRHNHDFGTTPEDFAHVSVVTREWAMKNPRAVMFNDETHEFGGPITIDDVNNSRLITWPLTMLHCCLQTDHGGAVLIARPEIARDLKTNPVWIAGAGESMSHSTILETDDFTATSAALSAKSAYEMAGLGPKDMESAMIYDSFTVTAAITAEMLGLAPRGDGYKLWKDGTAAPGGKLPINTNGGGLSFNHSGMYGMHLLVEAYRQLSGTAEDGINGIKGKQTNARTCVVNGTGGLLSTTGTLVLTSD
ncbi:MAG: thiolase [Gammaproteobacteria bacterium]|jgi:acetyl-CoA acetyltransferase|nr:thiolase [Gammaproteobacteria bacterium]MBT4493933.1 thiolase [Gammaproteobacteria bacterium]MBT7369143.1 thiolase [Gammaproteobacteria bacterium]